MKKPNYAEMFTLRKDGLFMGYWHELDRSGAPTGKRHAVYDRDPERLFLKIQEKESAAPPVFSFDAAAEAWFDRHSSRVGAKTAETYEAPLRRIRDRFSGESVEEVSAAEVQAFLADLGKRGYSRRSVQMHRDVLNMIFNDAIVSGALRFNPCAAVSMPRNLPVKRRELPSDVTLEAVKAGAELPFGLFALFCLYAGLRRGEVLALRWEDLDLDGRLIHVTRAVEFIGNEAHFKAPKSAAGLRTVPLLDPLAAALPPAGSGLIFPREDGCPLSKTQFRKRWDRYCQALGFQITAHQLRHGFATILFEAGVSDKDAQELLGHSSIAVTRDVYTHIRASRRLETAGRINAFFAAEKEKAQRRELVARMVSVLQFVVDSVVKVR